MRRSRFHPRRPPFDSLTARRKAITFIHDQDRTALICAAEEVWARELVHWSIILEHAVSAYYDDDEYRDQRQGLAFKRALGACTQGVSFQDDVIFCAVYSRLGTE